MEQDGGGVERRRRWAVGRSPAFGLAAGPRPLQPLGPLTNSGQSHQNHNCAQAHGRPEPSVFAGWRWQVHAKRAAGRDGEGVWSQGGTGRGRLEAETALCSMELPAADRAIMCDPGVIEPCLAGWSLWLLGS